VFTMVKHFSDTQKIQMACWVNNLAPWQIIAHHTFEWAASVWSARKSFERFMTKEVHDVSYFYAVEQNPSRDGHHVHALWSDCVGVQRSEIWKRWFDRYGRNRIEPVRRVADVAAYCSKYVTKNCGWWDAKIFAPGLPFAGAGVGTRPPGRSPGS
jgi:hypothetical protein